MAVEHLTPDQMLHQLSERGDDARSDYHDGDDIQGWFGWSVDGDVLTVTHEPAREDDDEPRPATASARWRLLPLDANLPVARSES